MSRRCICRPHHPNVELQVAALENKCSTESRPVSSSRAPPMPHWLVDFCTWLQQTHFSQVLQNVEWIIPAIQTIHILCIGAVISAALALTLRQFGLLAADQPLARASIAFLRVIWLALPV